MWNLFINDKNNAIKGPVYTDFGLYQALNEGSINVTKQEIQKARKNDGETLYKIGDAYYNNENYEVAFAWYYKAALQGYGEAQNQVGWMYRLGEGIPQDGELAEDWSAKAASTGNGQLHYERGILADYQNAANGDRDAMNSIGIKYRNGQGVTKNIPAAIKWYTRAANQGHVAAQINLGWVYKNEEQVKDLQKAVNWYQKAADNKHWLAEEYVIKLNGLGYYAKQAQEVNIQSEQPRNEAIQSPTLPSNNDDHFNNLIDSRMKAMAEAFELKMSLMEKKYEGKLVELDQEKREQHEENKLLKERLAGMEATANNDTNYDSSESDHDNGATTKVIDDALQKELAALKQEKVEQHEENRLLKERLAEMEGTNNNDLNYDSSESDHDNSATGKVIKDALQKELAALKQEKLEQHEENRLLKERLARMDAERQSDLMENDGNDINYDTESSYSEEEDNNATASTLQNKRRDNHVDKYTYSSMTNAKPSYESDDNYADPYYDSDAN